MVKDSEKEVMEWAAKTVKEPWDNMIKACSALFKGESGDNVTKKGAMPLVPIKCDYRTLAHVLHSFMPRLVGDNFTLWTLVLNEDETEVLFSSIELEKEGLFHEWEVLDVKIPIHNNIIRLLHDGSESKKIYPFLREYLLRNKGIELGAVKIANIKFFSEFKRAFDESGDDLRLFIGKALSAVRNIYANNWLRFHPEPPVFRMLRELLVPLLDVNEDSIAHLIKLVDVGKSFGILLRDRDYSAGFLVYPGFHVEFVGQDVMSKVHNARDLRSAAKRLREAYPVDYVFGVNAREILKLLEFVIKQDGWKSKSFIEGLMKRSQSLMSSYMTDWVIEPEPMLLKFANWAGIDVRTTKLPPELMTDGLVLLGGPRFQLVSFLLHDDKTVTAMRLQFNDYSLEKVSTINEPWINDLFKDLPLLEALKEAKFRLTKKYEWVHYVVGMKDSVISDGMRLFFGDMSKMGRFRNVKKLLSEDMVMFPSNPFTEILKKKGLFKFLPW